MSKRTILIIDDDVSLTQAMKINLEDTGNFEVIVENDSRQAIGRAEEARPDLILLDIVMPGLDGGDVSAQLKAHPVLQSIPVLIVTALVANSETGGGDAIISGGQAMIAKPVQFDKLNHVIETTLAGSV